MIDPLLEYVEWPMLVIGAALITAGITGLRRETRPRPASLITDRDCDSVATVPLPGLAELAPTGTEGG